MPSVGGFGLPPFEEIETALASDAPRRWGLQTSGQLSFIAEPEHGALWLLCPADNRPLSAPSQTSVISVSLRKLGDEIYYQVGSKSPILLREVYYFLCGVVNRVERTGENLPEAIASELVAWEALLRAPSSMDRSQEIGLLGELWVLWRILHNQGAGAIDCWTGPASELHDFRTAKDDLEVKTTLSHSREHPISGLDQLVTAQGRMLSVVSIQVKPAGGGPGACLREAIEKLEGHLSRDLSALKKFNDRLFAIGYRHDDGHRYSDRFCLRSTPTLVPVDEAFPRLTKESLANAMSGDSLRRIRKVVYTANLDGLGTTLDSHNDLSAIRRHEVGDLYA